MSCLPHEIIDMMTMLQLQLIIVSKIRNMMTSTNGNIFRVTGHLYGEFTGPGEFPAKRPVTGSFDVIFDLSLNKRLSKQSWGWWFETQSRLLWRHCNESGLIATSFLVPMYILEYDKPSYVSRGWLYVQVKSRLPKLHKRFSFNTYFGFSSNFDISGRNMIMTLVFSGGSSKVSPLY